MAAAQVLSLGSDLEKARQAQGIEQRGSVEVLRHAADLIEAGDAENMRKLVPLIERHLTSWKDRKPSATRTCRIPYCPKCSKQVCFPFMSQYERILRSV